MMIFRWIKKHRILVLLALLPVIIGIIAVLERGARDPYNRTVGPKKLFKLLFSRSPISQIGAGFFSPSEEVRLSLGKDFTTGAGIYDPGGNEPKPAIIVIHGHTAMGRQMSTYRVLGTKLAEKGFFVFIPDRPGLGDSDDPFKLGTAEGLDEVNLVSSAVQYLLSREDIDKGNLSLMGHSQGCRAAILACFSLKEIENVILMGPPRRFRERLKYKGDQMYFWERFNITYYFVYGKPVPVWFTFENWLKETEKLFLERYLTAFKKRGHLPLMLIDGEDEDERDKKYLEQYFALLQEPKKFVRLDRSDHYCNTAQSLGLMFYDKGVMNQLVDEITAWLPSPNSEGRKK